MKFLNDFADNALDTAKAPLFFIDYLDRVSGFKDYRDTRGDVSVIQEQAINETKIIKEGLKAIITDKEAWNLFTDMLTKDVQERPGYYAGGFFTANGLAKVLFTKFVEQNIFKASIVGAKIEETVHQLYEKSEQYITQNENINQPQTRHLTDQEIKDEVDKKLREYIEKNDITSLQDIKEFMYKTREELQNETIKIESKEQFEAVQEQEIQNENNLGHIYRQGR